MTIEQQPFEDVFPLKEFAIFSTYVSYCTRKVKLFWGGWCWKSWTSSREAGLFFGDGVEILKTMKRSFRCFFWESEAYVEKMSIRTIAPQQKSQQKNICILTINLRYLRWVSANLRSKEASLGIWSFLFRICFFFEGRITGYWHEFNRKLYI